MATTNPTPKPAATDKTATFLVGDCPIAHDKEIYQPGDEIALTEAQAKRLGAKVKPAPAKTTKE